MSPQEPYVAEISSMNQTTCRPSTDGGATDSVHHADNLVVTGRHRYRGHYHTSGSGCTETISLCEGGRRYHMCRYRGQVRSL
jgi:hypothetical protein